MTSQILYYTKVQIGHLCTYSRRE